MKKILLILLLHFSFIGSTIADDDIYDTAHKLASCSAVMELSSKIILLGGSGEAQSKVAKEKANGWLLASVVLFMADDMKSEGAWSAAQGIKDTELSNWLARIEFATNSGFTDKEQEKNLIKIMEEVEYSLPDCLLYAELVEESIKTYRKMAY